MVAQRNLAQGISVGLRDQFFLKFEVKIRSMNHTYSRVKNPSKEIVSVILVNNLLVYWFITLLNATENTQKRSNEWSLKLFVHCLDS